METRNHCTVCDYYDLCITCYEKRGGHVNSAALSSDDSNKSTIHNKNALNQAGKNKPSDKHPIETY